MDGTSSHTTSLSISFLATIRVIHRILNRRKVGVPVVLPWRHRALLGKQDGVGYFLRIERSPSQPFPSLDRHFFCVVQAAFIPSSPRHCSATPKECKEPLGKQRIAPRQLSVHSGQLSGRRGVVGGQEPAAGGSSLSYRLPTILTRVCSGSRITA